MSNYRWHKYHVLVLTNHRVPNYNLLIILNNLLNLCSIVLVLEPEYAGFRTKNCPRSRLDKIHALWNIMNRTKITHIYNPTIHHLQLNTPPSLKSGPLRYACLPEPPYSRYFKES